MKTPLLATLAFTFVSTLFAAERGTLIFEDDFARNESQETTDEIGKGWGSNSKARAGGNKQVDLKDGAMRIYMHATADHAVSVTHPAEFRDGSVELRFMLEDEKDRLGLDFADLQFKEVHAGHLFKVDVSAKQVLINDMKRGNMNLKYYDKNTAKALTAEDKAFLATTRKPFPATVEAGKWHSLVVAIVGDTVTVTLDGKEAGAFTSEGFAHPTKRMLRLAVPRQAVVDDVKVYSLPPKTTAR